MTRFIRLSKVLEKTGLSRTLVYKMLDEGTFPRPVKISVRINAWVESEIDEWIARQLAKRQE